MLVTLAANFVTSRFAKQLIENGVFKQIVHAPNFGIGSKSGLEEAEITTIKQFDVLLTKNEINLSNFEQIYTGCDNANDFAIYLSMKGFPYVAVELGTNQFNETHRLEFFRERLPTYYALNKKYGALDGTGEYAVKRLRLDNASYWCSPDYSKELEKDEWVDFDILLQTLPGDFKQKLLLCLDQSIHCLSREQTCLILNNSYGLMNRDTGLTHNINLLYQLMADYYVDGCDLFYKDHPQLGGKRYPLKNDIENIVAIEADVPMEFFKLVDGFSIRMSISIVTNAIERVKSSVVENIQLGASFYLHFPLLHEAFTIFSLAQKVATPSTAFYATGISMEFLEKFVKYVFPEFTIKDLKDRTKDTNADEDAFIIVGCISAQNKDEVVNILENATENTKVVLLNVTNVKNQWSIMPPNFVPITITKKATKEEGFLDCLDSELFYFYSPNQTIRETVQAFTLEKTLKHTKLHLFVRALPSVNATQHASIANFIDSWGYHTEKDNPILKQLQLRGKFEKDYPVNLAENDDPSSLKIQLLGELLAKQDLLKNANVLEKQIETLKCEKDNISLKIEEPIAENKRLNAENAENISKNATLTAENAEIIAKNAALTAENRRLSLSIAETIASNTTLTAESAEIIAKNAALIAENAILMRDIESLRLPRWLGHFLSNLHPKKKNRQRFREKYVKGKKQ